MNRKPNAGAAQSVPTVLPAGWHDLLNATRPAPENTKAVRHTPNRLGKKSSLVYGGRSRLSLLSRVHADEPPVAALILKFHDAGNQREQGVVLTLADIHASLMLGAALPHQNRARIDELSAKPLDAQPLPV